jgi:GDPmannose 4,6-dehydratase
VTRKITINVAERARGGQRILELGNLDAARDWGFAKEYVEGMHRMLQQEQPDDYVLATGTTTTVRRFVEMAFAVTGRTIDWVGRGPDEVGVDARTGETLVRINRDLHRPAEVDRLVGNPRKAKDQLGWEARTDLARLVEIMVESDLATANP